MFFFVFVFFNSKQINCKKYNDLKFFPFYFKFIKFIIGLKIFISKIYEENLFSV